LLTEKQKEAVRLLAIENKKHYEAAEIIGIHRCTLWRWSQTKAFRKEWQRQVRAYIQEKRKESGYYPSAERAAWRQRLRELEKKLHNIEVKNGDTKALDKAYKEFSDHLWKGVKGPF
jgi:hypothetical protein